jgi:Kef-type K+ transport system membrane component KefB
MNDIILLLIVPIIIFTSPFFAKLLKTPTVSIEIILGIIIGYIGISGDNYLLKISAEIGFIFLMFLAGLEVKFHKIIDMDKKLIKPTFFYILIVHLISFISIYIFSLPLILMTILPLVSISIIATLTKEYGGEHNWIKMAFIIGTIAEIISIIEFSLISNVMLHGFGFDLLFHLGYLALFIISSIVLFKLVTILMWWYPDISQKLTPQIDNQEKDIRLTMLILSSICALMIFIDLELALGAFVSGMFMRAFFITQNDLIHKLEGFGFGFLVPIFFIYTGISFDASSLSNINIIIMAFSISFIMIITRIIATRVFKNTLTNIETTLLGLSHSMPLSLLIALSSVAFNSGNLDSFYYNAFILAALLEVLIATTFIKIILQFEKSK